MFAKLSFPQRLQIGLVLAMAFLLVFGSNRLDQKHFTNIQTAVNSVYKDRVVVQDVIYQLTSVFHDKKLRFILKDNFQTVISENQKVEGLLADFGDTELTLKESDLLDKLNGQFIGLKDLENKVIETSGTHTEGNTGAAVKRLDEIGLSLNSLAKIQLEESGQLTQLSKKSLGMNILLSKLEIGFLIVIGIAMLALIFHPTKKAHALS